MSGGCFSKNEKTPMSGYYEVSKDNTIVHFCDSLIESYNYPKEKIVVFLRNYIMNRYNIKVEDIKEGAIVGPMLRPCSASKFARSYPILLDSWLSAGIGSSLKFTDAGVDGWFSNLYYINKSRMNLTYNLDINLDYHSNRDNILAIPNYLRSLILSDEGSGSDEYSSADEEK
jgi:hypothetical protein